MNRQKKLYLNTFTSLLCQVVTLICGFILPKYILSYFGSESNGLVNSITRFLSIITFLEMGISPVIQSNLYKPLAENNTQEISKIVVSSERFYRKIAYIFLAYITVLFFVFPQTAPNYDFWFTASLLLIISISTFAQYFFGITYQVFLNADQKVYVHTIIQIITVILNTAFSVVLIKMGCGLHIVKLVSALVFIIRPIAQNIYVKKHYQIDKKVVFVGEPIKQKWNGFAQHLAAVVCGEIDVILLTFFATYQKVSIYSVYLLVVSGVNRLIMTAVNGLESYWGNMMAKDETELVQKTFVIVEFLIHFGVTFVFVVTAITIAPFVSVYVDGISDSAEYYLPLFGAVLTFAYATQCLRIPYFRIIKAAGHYKQTQNGAFISMAINIALSLVLIFKFQLIGVALGTLGAMLYHTVYFAWYLRKSILNRKFYYFVKHIIIDAVVGILAYFLTSFIQMGDISYGWWILYACEVSLIVLVLVTLFNFVFYKKEFLFILKKLLRKKA